MDQFHYKDGQLHCEDLPVEDIVREAGTPCFVYSLATVRDHFRKFQKAFAELNPLICYSVKANSNLALLAEMVREGAGFDVVSGGELYRALKAGAPSEHIVFAGVGKTDEEIRYGIASGILYFNVESEEELAAVDAVAGSMGKVARVSLRCNPDVDPRTHKYISTGKRQDKFGIDFERAGELLSESERMENVEIRGLHLHIGSQITTLEPHEQAVMRTLAFLEQVDPKGERITTLNLGGGFGIFYSGTEAKTAEEFAERLVPLLKDRPYSIIFEPGRFMVGNAGILVTRITYRKESGEKVFLICDAGMNDLIRPALYSAFHRIWPVASVVDPTATNFGQQQPLAGLETADVVGPLCESGDYLGLKRQLPRCGRGELLAVFSAGAYGMAMSSNYNSRLRAAEVLVDGRTWRLVRRRERYEDLVQCEVEREGT